MVFFWSSTCDELDDESGFASLFHVEYFCTVAVDYFDGMVIYSSHCNCQNAHRYFGRLVVLEKLTKPTEHNYPCGWYPQYKLSSSHPQFSSTEKH